MPELNSTQFDFQFTANPYAALGGALDDLTERELILDEGASDRPTRVRTGIARTYLFLLGYLQKDNGKRDPDAAYRTALRNFQGDAGLSESAELNSGTWAALTQLAAFDTPIDARNWLHSDVKIVALKRAVHLRLFALGLMATPPKPKSRYAAKQLQFEKAFEKGLEQFVRVASLLGLTSDQLQAGLNESLLSLLFDQDALTGGLHFHGSGFRIFDQHPGFRASQDSDSKLVHLFIKNLAKVELWLLGYGVRPGNFKPEGHAGRDNEEGLHSALKEFCRDRNLDSRFTGNNDISLSSWFFAELGKINTEQNVSRDDEILNEDVIVDVLENRKKLRKLDTEYRSLGARLLDGIKRAVRFFRNLFRKFSRFVKRVLSNLSRLLHRSALLVYRRLKAVILALKEGGEFLFRTIIKGSNPEIALMAKDKDFDLILLANQRADSDQLARFGASVNLRARVFELACKIVSRLLDIVKFSLRLSGSVLSWMGVLLSLPRLWNWVNSVLLISSEAEQLMAALESGSYIN